MKCGIFKKKKQANCFGPEQHFDLLGMPRVDQIWACGQCSIVYVTITMQTKLHPLPR